MFEWQLYGMSGKMKAQSNLEFGYFRVWRAPAKTIESSAQPRSLFPGPCQPARHLWLKPSHSHQASNLIGEDALDLVWVGGHGQGGLGFLRRNASGCGLKQRKFKGFHKVSLLILGLTKTHLGRDFRKPLKALTLQMKKPRHREVNMIFN